MLFLCDKVSLTNFVNFTGAHLTALLTMRILNKQEMLDEILSEIKRLCEIDPKRTNYYNDLRKL